MPDPKLEPHFAVSSCERFAPPERVFLHNKAQLIRSLSRYAIVYSISNMVKNGPIHSSTQIQPLYETRMFALTVSSRDSKLNVFSVHGNQLTLSLTGAAATALQFGSGVDSPNSPKPLKDEDSQAPVGCRALRKYCVSCFCGSRGGLLFVHVVCLLSCMLSSCK